MRLPQFTLRQLLLACGLIAAGTAAWAGMWRIESRSHSNSEENVAVLLLAIGAALFGAGASIPFAKPATVVAIAAVFAIGAYPAAAIAYWAFLICYALFGTGKI